MRRVVAVAPGAGDRVIACAAAFTHLAVDHGAIGILKRDFAGLLGDPARRRAGAALDYQREQLLRFPAACTRCRAPGGGPGAGQLPIGIEPGAQPTAPKAA